MLLADLPQEGGGPRAGAFEAGPRTLTQDHRLDDGAHPQEYDRQLEVLAEESYPETNLLRRVHGIGTLTALSFVLTLEDPSRFGTGRAVGAYLGLVPSKDQSGERDPQKRISKQGNGLLRRLLVGSAQRILELAPIGHGRREGRLSQR